MSIIRPAERNRRGMRLNFRSEPRVVRVVGPVVVRLRPPSIFVLHSG